ncbi:head-tail joining protein [Aquabacterium sp.]|jgi:hypothetical protein|uniref:head-tail joining protein n=1 Tax=Aquabacterium sp. TaxID=1872578 RepID=UPI003B751B8D
MADLVLHHSMQPFVRLCISSFLHLGVPGTYRLADGREIPTRFIAKQADVVESFGDTRLALATHRFDVMSRDVMSPREGERFTVADQTYQVVGEPLADRDRLIWTLTGAPV